MKTIKDAKTFDELLDIKYGKLGTPNRDEFESRAKAFIVGEMIKDARKEAASSHDEQTCQESPTVAAAACSSFEDDVPADVPDNDVMIQIKVSPSNH